MNMRKLFLQEMLRRILLRFGKPSMRQSFFWVFLPVKRISFRFSLPVRSIKINIGHIHLIEIFYAKTGTFLIFSTKTNRSLRCKFRGYPCGKAFGSFCVFFAFSCILRRKTKYRDILPVSVHRNPGMEKAKSFTWAYSTGTGR